MRNSTNNKIPFFPFIFQKDFFGFILILCLYLLQTHFGISSFSHPDNALEVCGLLTPLHIVPEWYFLCQYAMLKAVPNKNAGFIILLTSIFTFFFFGEIRNLTTLCLLKNNGFSLSQSSFFLSSLSFLWIGAQFPQEIKPLFLKDHLILELGHDVEDGNENTKEFLNNQESKKNLSEEDKDMIVNEISLVIQN